MSAASIEAEVISAIVNTQDATSVKDAGITPADFAEHGDVLKFVLAYHKRIGKVPTAALLKVKFGFKAQPTDDMHGAITEFSEHRNKQRLLAIMTDAIEQIDSGVDVAMLSNEMRRSLTDVYSRAAASEHQSSVFHDWEAVYDHAAKRRTLARKHGALAGIPTGFPTLDAATGGFFHGEYWVYGARLGQGKTWTLIRTAVDALRTGHRVLYFALEQPRNQLSTRFHTFLSAMYGPHQFKASDLTQGVNYNLKQYRQFLLTLPKMCPGELIINDTPRRKLTTSMIAAQVERLQPDLVIVDYLGLLSPKPGDYTVMMEISADLKGIASEYPIAMICANQLNRQADSRSRAAGPETLAGSDSIGADADGVVTMLSTSERTQMLKLAKYRHGRDGMSWPCRFEVNDGVYEECTEADFLDLRDEDKVNGADHD